MYSALRKLHSSNAVRSSELSAVMRLRQRTLAMGPRFKKIVALAFYSAKDHALRAAAVFLTGLGRSPMISGSFARSTWQILPRQI